MGDRRRVLLSGVHGAYLASLIPAWRRFLDGARRPEATQRARLVEILRAVGPSAYGRAHGLERVSSPEELQSRAPIVDFEQLRPWIERLAAGEPNVLTTAPVRMFERTSGSSGGDKLVPYTAGLLAEFSAATGPWLASMYLHRPRLLGTTSYWSVSPAARAKETTAGGIPIGLEDDTEYFGPLARWALGQLMAVPGTVARIRDVEAWRIETARRLVEDEHLGMISVWSPSFLSRLVETIEREHETIARGVSAARGDALRRALDGAGGLSGPLLWPRLALISCWTDAQAARFVAPLERYFPGVEIQGKGLMATEGAVTFPLTTRGSRGSKVLAIGGHFFELLDLDAPSARPKLAHEVQVGGRYSPIMTTSGGLVRYHLKDELLCTGHHLGVPIFDLVGRVDRTSDLAGEKLNAAEVDRAVRAAEQATGVAWRFVLLAPELGTPPAYRLWLEGEHAEGALEATAARVEEALLSSHHYRYCRDLGQLGPVSARRVRSGWARYESALVARGMKAGDIKPTHLDSRVFWGTVFAPDEGAVSGGEVEP